MKKEQNKEKAEINLCTCYYPINTYVHTGDMLCKNCKKLIPCYATPEEYKSFCESLKTNIENY
jgi:hypothetical protein